MCRILNVVSTLLLCSMWVANAAADPIQLTSGTATVLDGGGGTFLIFSVGGANVSAVGSWDFGTIDFVRKCGTSPCVPGTTVTLSSTVKNDSLLSSSVGELGAAALITTNAGPLNGGRVVELLGTVAFTTPAVKLPEPGNGSGATLTAPFKLTGSVQGYNPFARDPTLLFTADVSGAGIARMSVPFNPQNGTFDSFGTLGYEFQTTAPTPEPASLLLFGAGIVAVATKRRRGIDRISSI